MSKVIVSMTIDSVLIEKFKERTKEKGATVSGMVSKLMDDYLGYSNEIKEKEKEDRDAYYKIREQEKEERRTEWEKMTPEQRIQQDRHNKCAELAYKGHTITDAMFRGEEALPEHTNFINKMVDTSEFKIEN